MDSEEEADNSIVEIDGERYLIPTVIKDGCLIPEHSKRIKLPIPMTEGLHINYASPAPAPPAPPAPKKTLKERFITIITLGLRDFKVKIKH
jgi:hypothetical protein